MWSFLASLIGGPIVNGLIDAYKARLAAGNTTDKMLAEVAQRELEVQAREVEAQNQLRIAQIGKWYEPEHLFGYTLWLYFAKCIIWDKVFALGSTDPLTGAIDGWAGLIIMTYFGKRGIENVARILRRQ